MQTLIERRAYAWIPVGAVLGANLPHCLIVSERVSLESGEIE